MPRLPADLTALPERGEPIREIGCAEPAPKLASGKPGTSAKPLMRAVVRISNNLPVTQVEIEVIASLLDDCESLFPMIGEAAE
jgi:hypothetical protein